MGIVYKMILRPFRHPSILRQARDIASSGTADSSTKLKDPPIPKFVEPVETNPEVISVFALHPTLRQAQGPGESLPFLSPLPPSTSSGTTGRGLGRRSRDVALKGGGGATHASPFRRRGSGSAMGYQPRWP